MLDLIHSETVTVPGLYRMSEAAYHADPCPTPSLSRSVAYELLTKSARHAKAVHPRLSVQEEKEEMNSRARDIGSAAHALLLGQPTEIACLDYKDFKKKAAQEERAMVQKRGGIGLIKPDFEKATEMVQFAREVLAAEEHPAIQALVRAGTSATIFNEVTGAWIDPCGDNWARFRADRLHIEPGLVTCIDYKTTEQGAAPEAVAKTIFNNGYHFQDGFYRRGLRILFPEIDQHQMKLDFIFIVQEQDPPFEMTVTRIDAAGRIIGEKMVSDAFRLWRKHMAENLWPGYPRGIMTAEMPPFIETRWMAKEIEDPRLQNLGHDPVNPYETHPYRTREIAGPC
ncbi:PD-(D/E)XK nuclease-like domain-containing protein [Gellertiella hungarica]|uniref:Putative exodeoxyribonuclease 8 PDDEXK-like domain-containing protein n=1 Tax=Gellertiella hungarica TaxID=1572859 RepID=A0A7W6J8M0_9HYPH|nr:PD-(D/E)XK nuclease-like domain-containing protein [Gellertiella hungarica]MBB4066795.1 hypothetical protein [Gellertiella hungarica]